MKTFATIQEALASFKNEYVTKSVEYAKKEFETYRKYADGAGNYSYLMHNYVAAEYPHLIDPACTYPFNFYNSINKEVSKDRELRTKIENAATKIERIVRKHTIETYTEAARAEAEASFEDSLAKLMARIAAKNINLETATIYGAHIDQNLNVTITDGKKTVNAHTILAWGPVQRPHYRYIVK